LITKDETEQNERQKHNQKIEKLVEMMKSRDKQHPSANTADDDGMVVNFI
jgi:hypothetical protein